MNAYEIPGLRFSVPAGADVKRRRFINVNAASAGVYATAAESAIGVSMNEADTGEVLELSDGIVMVEAEAKIVAGKDVQVGTDGKAITKTTGIGVGVALTGAAGAGNFLAVKLVSVSATGGADGENGKNTQTILYTSENLAAGVDLSDVVLGVVGGAGVISRVDIISAGSAAGIDAENTSVFGLKVGITAKAAITFDETVTFPASGAITAMTLEAIKTVAAGDVLLLDVTNGATADLPVFAVQVFITLN